jgi:tetratricopeptide (TPR) repeat protein
MLDQGRLAESIRELEEGVRDPRNGTNPFIHLRLGRAYVFTGRYAEAIPLFEKAAALGPDETYLRDHVQADLGDACFRAGRFLASAEAYRKARGNNPENPNHLLGQVRALIALGRLDDARRAVHEMLGLHPESAVACEALAEIERQEQRYDAALLWYYRAHGFDPHRLQVLEGMEACLERMGEIEKARELRAWRSYLASDATCDTPFPEKRSLDEILGTLVIDKHPLVKATR